MDAIPPDVAKKLLNRDFANLVKRVQALAGDLLFFVCSRLGQRDEFFFNPARVLAGKFCPHLFAL